MPYYNEFGAIADGAAQIFHDDVTYEVAQVGGTGLTGTILIQEYVPGVGWVTRATETAIKAKTVLPAGSKNGPTQWRAKCSAYTAGTFGVSLR